MEGLENEIIANVRCDLLYLNNKINDFELPKTFNDFRKKVKSTFGLDTNLEDILVVYKMKKEDKEKIIEVKTDEEYSEMLKRINSKELEDDSIFIETEKVPNEISRQDATTFEEEIACLVECELKAAGERIKNSLSGNKKCCPTVQNQDIKACNKCSKVISGKIYRSVTDIDEKNYCEKCSYDRKEPVLISP